MKILFGWGARAAF